MALCAGSRRNLQQLALSLQQRFLMCSGAKGRGRQDHDLPLDDCHVSARHNLASLVRRAIWKTLFRSKTELSYGWCCGQPDQWEHSGRISSMI